MNKKLLAIMISLFACSTLVVGCGKKQAKPSSEPQPAESSEPEPGPEPEPEPEPEPKEEIQIPKTIEEAKFLTFDEDLQFDYANVEEYYGLFYFPGHGVYTDPEDAGLIAFETYSANETYRFDERYASTSYELWRLEGHNDDTYYEYYDEADYYQYDGFDRVMSSRNQDEYVGLHDEEDNYYYLYCDFDTDQYFPEFSFYTDSAHYFLNEAVDEMEYDTPSPELSHGMPNLFMNDDYFAVVSNQLSLDTYANVANYGDEEFNYLLTAREQIIYLFDRETTAPLAYYAYYEETVDHDTYTGKVLEEPVVSYKYIDVVTFEYGEMTDISEAETFYLPTELPELYFDIASIEVKVAAAELNDEGELVAAPALSDSFNSYTPYLEFLSFDEIRLSFAPYLSNADYIALELGCIYIDYYEPLTSNSTGVTYDLNQPSVYNQIVDVLGGQILEFEGQNYLILDASQYVSLGLIISATNTATEQVKVVPGSLLAYFA